MRVTKNILIVILFLSAVTFSLQNAEEVTIHYYGLIPPLAVPLFIVVLAAVLLGIIVGAVGEVLTDVKLRMELRKQKKKIDEIKREQKIQESEVLTKPELPLSSTIKD